MVRLRPKEHKGPLILQCHRRPHLSVTQVAPFLEPEAEASPVGAGVNAIAPYCTFDIRDVPIAKFPPALAWLA